MSHIDSKGNIRLYTNDVHKMNSLVLSGQIEPGFRIKSPYKICLFSVNIRIVVSCVNNLHSIFPSFKENT